MTRSEVEALGRAHQLFTGDARLSALDAGISSLPQLKTVVAQGNYQQAARRSRATLLSAARTDAAAAAVIAGAHRGRAAARELTGRVVDEARADAACDQPTPLAQREAMRRRVARLRAQHAHVISARRQARRHVAALRALHYRMAHHPGSRRMPAVSGRAGIAVRAALSRLGRPYVWGATGPNQFDCSGLVQWSYAQAGLHLDRTTYEQINDGIVVPHSQVRPGDLVFPHAGHVQMAIGNNLVVEAPYSGASVRISQLGNNVQIRRPY